MSAVWQSSFPSTTNQSFEGEVIQWKHYAIKTSKCVSRACDFSVSTDFLEITLTI
jgi:hypothetical protein